MNGGKTGFTAATAMHRVGRSVICSCPRIWPSCGLPDGERKMIFYNVLVVSGLRCVLFRLATKALLACKRAFVGLQLGSLGLQYGLSCTLGENLKISRLIRHLV